jgi:hypothetical protein
MLVEPRASILMLSFLIACGDPPTKPPAPDRGSATIHFIGATDPALAGATDTVRTGTAEVIVATNGSSHRTMISVVSGKYPGPGSVALLWSCDCLVAVGRYVVSTTAKEPEVYGALTGMTDSIHYASETGTAVIASVSNSRVTGSIRVRFKQFGPPHQFADHRVVVDATFSAPVHICEQYPSCGPR